jgi:hypothetical protein
MVAPGADGTPAPEVGYLVAAIGWKIYLCHHT